MSQTLSQIRKESNLKLREVVRKLGEIEPGSPRTHCGVLHIERRGTDRLPLIRAFASIYNVPIEVIEAACAKKNVSLKEHSS